MDRMSGPIGIMQTTLIKPVCVSGVGLHTGYDVNLALHPAPAGTGVAFRRVDLKNFEIPARRKYVSRVVLATTLMRKGVMLSTVEHVLSALYGLAIDNVYVDVDSLEVPILDGSAQPFVDMVRKAGVVRLRDERTFLKVEEPIKVSEGEKFIRVEPADGFHITYLIDFEHPAIRRQEVDFRLTPATYLREVAYARTFGFLKEVEQLRKSNLIRGGSLENAVVLSEEGVVNGELRAPDEFVRHKVLDLIGDISLCGYPVLGHLVAFKAGHALHTRLATELARSPACRLVQESDLPSDLNGSYDFERWSCTPVPVRLAL